MKDKKVILWIGIVFLFLATVSFTYAYFTATLINKDVKDQIVTTGTLQLTYTDGPEIVMNNIKPGATIAKEVSVKNTGTLNAAYNLVWQELYNEIINDEMVIKATCTRYNGDTIEGTCESLTSTPIKRIKIKENVSIEPNITHKYNITITFKEANADQNYNQGKSFTGTLGINEYVDNTPIYCTFDGDMIQGAEYVNGQYTYRYMQQLTLGLDNDSHQVIYLWENITADGWGVTLTDKESTTPVTSKLCTYINNKPVVSMHAMFLNSQAKTIDLSSFNTNDVINMSGMFSNSQAKTLDLSNFDTSKVTDMSGMFSESKATFLELNSFDTSKVTNMGFMFDNSGMTMLNVTNFNTKNVTNMENMFSGSQATLLDLSSFDTSNVITMESMFNSSQAIEIIGLETFNTSKVTDMSGMFADTQVTMLDLSSFDTSNVTNMIDMFANTQVIMLDLSSFDTSNVIDMSYMFYGSAPTTLDLSSFNTSKVTNMNWMFAESRNLRTIYVSVSFRVDKVVNENGIFYLCTNLIGGNGTKYNSSYVDKTYARIDADGTPGYFTKK